MMPCQVIMVEEITASGHVNNGLVAGMEEIIATIIGHSIVTVSVAQQGRSRIIVKQLVELVRKIDRRPLLSDEHSNGYGRTINQHPSEIHQNINLFIMAPFISHIIILVCKKINTKIF